MKLWALSDLHVGMAENRRAVSELPVHREHWLILAGDLGERPEDLEFVFDTLGPRFARLLWTPGNHELWTTSRQDPLRPDFEMRPIGLGTHSPEIPIG